MTPTQLRAFCAVVQHGSVKGVAAEPGVTEAAVSIHVAHLRKELEDRLFTPTRAGLAFTAGGLRLASRASELLALQDLTIREVNKAAHGRRPVPSSTCRGAAAALQPVALHEALLHGIQHAVLFQSLDSTDLVAAGHRSQHGARLHRLAVQPSRHRFRSCWCRIPSGCP